MAVEVPRQVREIVPEGETVEYADRAVIQKPFTKVRYYGWLALTDEALHFSGETIQKEWVFPPTPKRSKAYHIPYDKLKEVGRGDVSKAEIRARGSGRFYLFLQRPDDEKTAHWARRQGRLVERLRAKAPTAGRGDKAQQYPFFRKVQMAPHKAMNPRQLAEAIDNAGDKWIRHAEIWEADLDEDE